MATIVDESGLVNPPPSDQPVPNKKIRDARGNWVTDKPANGAFLAYREYKVKEEEKSRLKAEKIKRREEKIARGEELGPEDRLEKEPSSILTLLRAFVILIVIIMTLGWFITGSIVWEYDGKWVRLSTYLPDPSRHKLLHELELAQFDGSTPGKPIYLAVDGDVYDVTEGAHAYGPGGKYHNFAGVDAARAFATQCTTGLRTHDLRGLSTQELQAMAQWKKFFEKKYTKVGRVLHLPIKQSTPIPGPCGEEEKPVPKVGPEAGNPAKQREKPPSREDL